MGCEPGKGQEEVALLLLGSDKADEERGFRLAAPIAAKSKDAWLARRAIFSISFAGWVDGLWGGRAGWRCGDGVVWTVWCACGVYVHVVVYVRT